MAIGFLAILKPVAMLWFGLKALDDVALIMRLVRLGSVVILPPPEKEGMCDLCDDVMGDLLVQGGVEALPCRLLCLRIPKCIEMCESVQTASQTSTKYPCVAAGYCNDGSEEDGSFMESGDIICEVGPFFSCQPSKYCHRARRSSSSSSSSTSNLNFHWSCQLRPGIGRWVGLQTSFQRHAGAVAAGWLRQPHCSEPNAGPYCIAKPKGLGAVCEILGSILSILYGGYRSIRAIESPGGDDDTQWLTFWLIFTMALSLERFFARPILSTLPLYYELKLIVMVWLLFFKGSERAYRQFRRWLVRHGVMDLVTKQHTEAHKHLAMLEEIGKALIQERLQRIEAEIAQERRQSMIQRRQSVQARQSFLASSRQQVGDGKRLSIQALMEDFEVDIDDYEDNHDEEDDRIAKEDTRQSVENLTPLSKGKSSDKGTNVLAAEKQGTARDAALKLSKLCDYILSAKGTQEVLEGAAKTVSEDANSRDYAYQDMAREDRARLLEIASQYVQFQPKYLQIRLLGTASGLEGELPAMDDNGLADPYVVFRLITSREQQDRKNPATRRSRTNRSIYVGNSPEDPVSTRSRFHELFQKMQARWKQTTSKYEAVSRTLRRTTRPQWNELLDLPLNSGYIDEDGMYRNTPKSLESTYLCVKVWDADVGVWGVLLRTVPFVSIGLCTSALLGYVSGVSDLLENEATWHDYYMTIQVIYVLVGLLLLLSYVMAVVQKADDEPVGQCMVPLQLLFDKTEHSLRLTLREMEPSSAQTRGSTSEFAAALLLPDKESIGNDLTETVSSNSNVSLPTPCSTTVPTNSVGGLGVIRVRLLLSES